jgi:hypothetical protein
VIPSIAGRSIDVIALAGGTWFLTVDVLQRSPTNCAFGTSGNPGACIRCEMNKVLRHQLIVGTCIRPIEHETRPVAFRSLRKSRSLSWFPLASS